MPTREMNLTEQLDRFIESGVASGRFSNASEELRLLERREKEDRAKIEWLRAAANEGFDAADRGKFVALHNDREIDEFLIRCARQSLINTATETQSG